MHGMNPCLTEHISAPHLGGQLAPLELVEREVTARLAHLAQQHGHGVPGHLGHLTDETPATDTTGKQHLAGIGPRYGVGQQRFPLSRGLLRPGDSVALHDIGHAHIVLADTVLLHQRLRLPHRGRRLVGVGAGGQPQAFLDLVQGLVTVHEASYLRVSPLSAGARCWCCWLPGASSTS
ncbi:hypothetical protein D3C81_1491210 [compost metagenome]